jgi:mono/diheme cytochrome c family protein
MKGPYRIRSAIFVIAVAALIVSLRHPATGQAAPALPWHPVTASLPIELLTQQIPDSTPNAAMLRRGQYLVAAGDCMSCHLREGGEPLAGGLGLNTPFGVIYSPNITSDKDTGIGSWSSAQFYRAMHDGIGAEGKNLYPAFPYPWFRLLSREDDDAILAFLKTTPAVTYSPPENRVRFPLNIRSTVKGWNLLYLDSYDFRSNQKQTAEWNRGAFLVNGPGHCSGCHTPRNVFGADKTTQAFYGGPVDNWVAPDLTGNDRTGLGRWSVDAIAEYLSSGRNSHAGAGGAMADVITYSTSLMTDADRHAIAVYLKSQAASPSVANAQPDAAAMCRGAAIYSDACASCHLENGVGQPRYFPPLGLNAALQQSDPMGLEHLILAGGRIGTSGASPSPLTMPSFAWKLNDQGVADVATFVRNSWGNHASAISTSDVQKARKLLNLETVHLTANSGDQN